MAFRKTASVKLFWRLHPILYRWTGGAIGGRVIGMPVLLLTTTGRKSGRPRTKALTYLPKGDAFVVIASYLGEPNHPAWWLNLEANSDAKVRVGRRDVPVTAREARSEEREALWQEVVAATGEYAEYEARTTRRIPVVVLEPRAESRS